jgi:hypothetical protein
MQKGFLFKFSNGGVNDPFGGTVSREREKAGPTLHVRANFVKLTYVIWVLLSLIA